MSVPPTISVSSTEFLENSASANVEFVLSSVAEEPVEFFYTTAEGTAKEGIDFEVSTGTVVFAPGETVKSVSLNILSDDILEFDETFSIDLAQLVNATVPSGNIELSIIDDDSYIPEEDADGFITPDSYPSMELVWSDEFDGSELNPQNWSHELGNGCPNLCGWGNEELQNYSEDNTQLNQGKLIITASNQMGNIYTSSRINTKGKQEFTHGRIDIRAKLPFGQGIWPALWMLGANIDEVGWPVCGEIDIMEMVGHQPGTVHGTAHYDRDGHQFDGTGWPLNAPERYADKFHVFSILWQEGQIEWFVDYQKFFTINDQQVGFNYPFDKPFFFIANIAVGGLWPGEPDATTTFPQTMEVDYIRVFQTQ